MYDPKNRVMGTETYASATCIYCRENIDARTASHHWTTRNCLETSGERLRTEADFLGQSTQQLLTKLRKRPAR